jgi:predicted nucleotidyltransferase
MLEDLFYLTNAQKTLNFLVRDPAKCFLAREIKAAARISKPGVNAALQSLIEEKLVRREKRGHVYFYQVNLASGYIIKQLKILQNLILIRPLINKLKSECKIIILYGSCARGEDTPESDIDLFVVSTSIDQMKGIAKTVKPKIKVQIVARTPLAYVEMEKKDSEFHAEVLRGLILWEEGQ